MSKEVEHILVLKKRRHVRKLVTSALKKGKLCRPKYCELCFAEETHIEAHHVDYGRPLAVHWLCKKCHMIAHTKDHALNPDNNYQTPSPHLVDCKDLIQVTVLLPIENFRMILETAQKKKISVSKLLKARIIQDYPVKSAQLEFSFEEKNDHTQKEQHARVPRVEKNQERVQQLQFAPLRQIRSEGFKSVPRVATELLKFPAGYGADADQLQRNCAN
jgi:hypothetical protein